MILALILFLLMYVLLLVFPNYRPYIALLTALLFVITGILPIGKIFLTINFNVLMMIAGTMGIVSMFIESGMPSLMADVILEKMPDVKWTIISMSLFAGIVSAFVDNVATVLMIAPVAIQIAKKFNISPVPMVICISVSSNLQGAATLVGDTTSILLGGYAGMDFLDFFFFKGKPCLFWVEETGAILTMLFLYFKFRKEDQPTESKGKTIVTNFIPTYLLSGTVLLLIFASIFPNKPENTNGYICMTLLIIGLIINYLQKGKSLYALITPIKDIDFETLFLLVGLFVVIGGVTEAGVIDAIANLLMKLGGNNVFLTYTIIVFASVAFSAFIDNIPFVATMLPVVQGLASQMGIDPYILYFGLLVGATLGGNITPIGASANITSIGMLRREGYVVKTSDFMNISVPFTIIAVLTGYIMVWLIWA